VASVFIAKFVSTHFLSKTVFFMKMFCVLKKRLNVRRLREVLCGCSNFRATVCCEQVNGELKAVCVAGVVLNFILHCHRKALFEPSLR
jgi:hypothetical protein